MRLVAGIVATLLASLAIASAAQADTIYPNGGSTFTTGTDGWFDQGHDCVLIVIPNALCQVSNVWDAANGNPQGSLRANFTSIALLLTTIRGTSTFESPQFVVTENNPASALFRIDRRAAINALLDVGGSATELVRLYDSTAGTATTVIQETLTKDNGSWGTKLVNLPASLFTKGHRYAFRVITYFNGPLQALFGTGSVNYDNIGVLINDTPVVGT